jgi:hypothetical protein
MPMDRGSVDGAGLGLSLFAASFDLSCDWLVLTGHVLLLWGKISGGRGRAGAG